MSQCSTRRSLLLVFFAYFAWRISERSADYIGEIAPARSLWHDDEVTNRDRIRQRIRELDAEAALERAPEVETLPFYELPEAAADQKFSEPAFRDLEYWQRVEPGEILLAIGPPTAYIALLTVLSAAYHLGLWGFNPFVEWAGAFPSFCAFSVWILGMPGFLRWRIAWRGWRPLPTRFVEEQDESFIEVDVDAVTLDERRFDFASTTGVLGRWHGSERRGWLLAIDDGAGEALLSSAASSQRWGDIKAVAHPAEPRGAWRVSERALLHIADRIAVE